MTFARKLSSFSPWILLLAALPQLLDAQTTVTLATSANPSIFGAPVILTASVTPSNAGGRVAFYDGGTLLATKPLSSGSASITAILLPAGTRKLTASFNGGGSSVAYTSNVVTQMVTAAANGGFLIQNPLSVSPATPTAVAVGDFNGDGRADLVLTGGAGSGTVTVLLGKGDGSFQAPVTYSVGTNPRFVTVGDLDGDGVPDLAVSGSALNILLGNGDGTFRQGASYAAPAEPISMGDLNGDAIVDLAVGGAIWIGNGDGTFHSQGLANPGCVGCTISTIAASWMSDLNGDGKADLLLLALQCAPELIGMGQTVTFCSDNVYFFPGNGNGTFQSPVEVAGEPAVGAFAAGDFNGDGRLDLFLGNSLYGAFLLGAGDGTFHPQAQSLGIGLGPIVTGDFNGDGITDLAVAAADNTLLIVTGKGDGSFQLPGATLNIPSHDVLAVADFNGDGRADLILANTAGKSIDVLLGAAPGAGFQLIATAGTPQSARTGAAFAEPLTVTLLNNGVPVAGAVVSITQSPFFSYSSSAILSSATAITNASGMAAVTAIANQYPGGYTVTASAQGINLYFFLTNTGNQIVAVTLSAPQFNTVGTSFPLQAAVQDTGGPSSGVLVNFTAPASGASAVLSSATAVTDATGVATVTATANGVAGSYPVTATVADGSFAKTANIELSNLAGGSSNLALGKNATQSSTYPYPSAAAGAAVDGTTDGRFSVGSVTATNLDANAWWQVDLGASATVGSIVIWNRTDCCGDRLSDYWVFVSDTPFLAGDTPATLQNRAGTFASHQTSAPNPAATIAVNGAQGRYVRVQLGGTNYLSLAEVQVFATGGAPPPSELAHGKQAAQSSALPGAPGAVAGLAVDGNTDGVFFDGSVTATNLDANPWWQVDLGASAAVSSVVIWNRTDCCADRLSDYWVFLSNTPFLATDTPDTLSHRAGTFASHRTSAPGPSSTIAFQGAPGRYVRVQLSGANYLSLAEVQVFGTGGLPATVNVAQGKAATQSSTLPGVLTASAGSAVDGNPDGNFYDGSVTATNLDANAWWQVDLGASTAVSSVVIFNRTDCCGPRLSDYWVFVSDTPFLAADTPTTLQNRAGTFSSHQTIAPNPSTPITVAGQGRYVRVQLTGANYLSLAEVQVFGQ